MTSAKSFEDVLYGCGFEKTDMVKYKPFSQNDSIDDLYKARQFNKNTFYNTLTQFSENKSSNDISENSINKLFLIATKLA